MTCKKWRRNHQGESTRLTLVTTTCAAQEQSSSIALQACQAETANMEAVLFGSTVNCGVARGRRQTPVDDPLGQGLYLPWR